MKRLAGQVNDYNVLDDFAAQPTAHDSARFRAPFKTASETDDGFIWQETEWFQDYGGWKLDTQFTREMGAPYLLAAGIGTPLPDATTIFHAVHGGQWRAWVRCKDWLPEFSPGRFAIVINGVISSILGCSGVAGWHWQDAGSFTLLQGDNFLALHDMTGFFARCDAILLTRNMDYRPPESPDELERERARLSGMPMEIQDGGMFDVLVAGGGPAGMAAAVAAARTGARTILLHDRPVLGGNASNEMGILPGGATVHHENARECGLNEEANLLWRHLNLVAEREGRPKSPALSEAYANLAAGEPLLTVRLNERVAAVEMKGDAYTAISVVVSHNTLTGQRSRVAAAMFIDCTGDGWLGHYAGADERIGGEAATETQEPPNLLLQKGMTMSSSLMGDGTLGFRAVPTSAPVPFQPPEWAKILPPDFCRNPESVGGQWWLEHAATTCELFQPEEARDELIRLSFAYWDWIKNKWANRHLASNYALHHIGFMLARREGRRLLGDYILNANDIMNAEMFDDRIAYGGWALDLHDPKGLYSPFSNGWGDFSCPFPVRGPIYSIPFRCLYSRNVDNLFFAGRCQSATHLALASVRVEATLSTLGQAAGTAAARCVQLNVCPRILGQNHIRDLQQLLLKNDQHIPEIKNCDPLDVARSATVSATSCCPPSDDFEDGGKAENVIDGVTRHEKGLSHAWISSEDQPLPQTLTMIFPREIALRELRIIFDTDLSQRLVAAPMPPTLVKSYAVEALVDGVWTRIIDEPENVSRLRVHDMPPMRLSVLRIIVLQTYGSASATIFEVRAYE